MADMKRFTREETDAIRAAARKVWNDIAYDILHAVPVHTGMPRSQVIECIIDADRLSDQLARDKADPLLIERVNGRTIMNLAQILRPAFPDQRYFL